MNEKNILLEYVASAPNFFKQCESSIVDTQIIREGFWIAVFWSDHEVTLKWNGKQEALIWKVRLPTSCARQHFGSFCNQKGVGSPVTVVSHLLILSRSGDNILILN